jgi:hypothetical protein
MKFLNKTLNNSLGINPKICKFTLSIRAHFKFTFFIASPQPFRKRGSNTEEDIRW